MTSPACVTHYDRTHSALTPAGTVERTEDGLYLLAHVPAGVESETIDATTSVLADVTTAGADGCDPTDYRVVAVVRDFGGATTTEYSIVTTREQAMLAIGLDAEWHNPGVDHDVYVTTETTGRVDVVDRDRAIDDETGEVRADYARLDLAAAYAWATSPPTAANNHLVRSGRAALAALAGR